VAESIRRVFFGCNYNDTRIKAQFDTLKQRLETKFPIDCVVIDKRSNKSAKDIWKDIREEIRSCGLCFFDVTAFRPNVMLELGYALAVKEENQIFITWRKRKSKGKMPSWLLSDLSHLNRYEYTSVDKLDQHIESQLNRGEWMTRIKDFNGRCTADTNAPDKYVEQGLKVFQALRDGGPKTETQLRALVQGSAIRIENLKQLMKKSKTVKRTAGNPGRFYLVDS
jgi:hypothetical protein